MFISSADYSDYSCVARPPPLPSVRRPYLAIQLSAARGQILEWAARGDMLCYTASSSSVQVDTKIMTTF